MDRVKPLYYVKVIWQLNKILVIMNRKYHNHKLQTKVRKEVKIRKQYNQVPHLTQDTTWESNKNTISITNKSLEFSPFPAGDHKSAMNRRKGMRNTKHKTQKTKMIHKRSTPLERSVKIFYWGGGGLNPFHVANLTISSDVDLDT